MPEREKSPIEIDAEFDRLLQSALHSYADPGSDQTLAARVLARVAAGPERKRTFRWIPWAIAVPVAAGLLIFILPFGSHPPHPSIDQSNQATVSHPPSTSTAPKEQSSILNPPAERPQKLAPVKAHRPETLAKAAPLPKLQVFPTPQPLTPAERALADYAAHAPQADRQALIETQKKLDEPLSIAAIQIQPLDPPEPGGN